jgi:hypothetical protein
MTRFGDFAVLCSQTPSYPWCNLFYRQVCHNPPLLANPLANLRHHFQILTTSSSLLTGLSENQSAAPVGVNPECGILKAGTGGSLGNIANIIVCALSVFFVAGLVVFSSRRKAAVGTSSFAVPVHSIVLRGGCCVEWPGAICRRGHARHDGPSCPCQPTTPLSILNPL